MSEDINKNDIMNGAENGSGITDADPFQKTDSMLNAEGSDLLSELAEASGDPIPEITMEDFDSAAFDAVVDADGEIEGLLNETAEGPAGDETIPAVIAAASEDAAEEGDMDKKNGKGKRSAKAKKGKGTTGTKKVRRRASFWQVLVRLFVFFMCIGIIGGCALAVGASLYIADVTADDDRKLDIDNIKLSLATLIMVQDEETGEWMEHERLYSGENRVWVDYADLPDCLIDAVIASEDIRFRSHHGVDWKRTIFAFLNQFLRIFNIHLAENIQGGSTITQQLIKNITGEKNVDGFEGILRKVREIYRALNMEKNYSKTQIMEAYLNTFSLGDQVAGIESAAKYYFGKTTSELDLAESCALVCITKYPTLYNPYLNPEENRTQRNYILRTMLENEMITQTQYDNAKAESDAMVFDEANKESASTSWLYDYFTDTVIQQVYDDLREYLNLSSDEAYDLLYRGGLKIYTTMQPSVQAAVERAAWNTDIWPDYKVDSEGNREENQIEAAMVVMDYEGRVLGIANGIREKTTSRSLLRGYKTTRQTGSAMKPVAVYAPAIELKKIHFSTLFRDAATEYINGRKWPTNFTNTYGSPITVYKAVCKSLNTVAVETMNLVGVDFAFDFLTQSLGFTTLVDNRWDENQQKWLTDKGLSMALGGLTDGCTVTEMCAAYSTFGNLGIYKSPRFYTVIEDYTGDVILDKNKVSQTNQAMSPQTAYIMNQIMQGVTREGTATAVRKGAKFTTASKTGTTSDNNDYWTIALNPYYCCAGWMGFDQNGKMNPYSLHYDIQYAVRDILNDITNDLPDKEFERPEGIKAASFCLASGLLTSAGCSNNRTGYYTSDNMPNSACMHEIFPYDGNGGYTNEEG